MFFYFLLFFFIFYLLSCSLLNDYCKGEAPILWASTYHAGEILDGDATLTHKERILKGYEAQNEMVIIIIIIN